MERLFLKKFHLASDKNYPDNGEFFHEKIYVHIKTSNDDFKKFSLYVTSYDWIFKQIQSPTNHKALYFKYSSL